jgi:hypothetical protein
VEEAFARGWSARIENQISIWLNPAPELKVNFTIQNEPTPDRLKVCLGGLKFPFEGERPRLMFPPKYCLCLC